MKHPAPLPLFDKKAVCSLLGLSPRCLENMVKEEVFPRPIRMGRYVYWREDAVYAWHERRFAPQREWVDSHAASNRGRHGRSGS
ncbi:AlpA family phage regulatory protein [Aquabacterium lacunae]|uniref:AlpA family phage regulatory protein n=1 Tax=Aquabacterium lacunae TaxID=2528630 RepID=A0A4Q9H6B5_9BURK|nr:AlpA family phage regulatory protein [Aquabacterium lacunae]TBO34467.1 AlpA family phage regulatory protein [Aquabacterium lacunae]